MRVSVTNISAGCDYEDNEFVLEVDNRLYLFNVCEGTQRICNEYAIRLTRLKAIFLSSLNPYSIGGLPGMLLSIYDMGVKTLTIFGPKGIQKYIDMLQLFIVRPDYCIHIKEIGDCMSSIDLGDSVFVIPCSSFPKKPYSHTLFEIKSYIHQIADTIKDDIVFESKLSYLINIEHIKGKFRPDLAEQLHLPKGPLYTQLCKGETIIWNEQMITPDMVMDEPTMGPSLLLMNSTTFDAIQRVYENVDAFLPDGKVVYIYHMLPQLAERHSFHNKEIHHMYLASTPFSSVHVSSLSSIQHVSTLFPSFFLHMNPEEYERVENNIGFLDSQQLVPYVARSFSANPKFTKAAIRFPEENEVKQRVDEVFKHSQSSSLPGKVLFLGTGSAIPSKYRNVSGLIYEANDAMILMDCGEGTLHQLLRLSVDYQETFVSKLKVIILSHSHADHHLGLVSLLYWYMRQKQRLHAMDHQEKKRRERRLLIMGPRRVELFLRFFCTLFPSLMNGYDYISIHFPSLPEPFHLEGINSPSFQQQLLNFSNTPINGVESKTTHDSLSVVDHRNGFRYLFFYMMHTDDSIGVLIQREDMVVVYTGDGRPTEDTVNILKPFAIKLLINESTFNEDHKDLARVKRHCTKEEALQFGKQIRADYILLTHFSQRYPKNIDQEQNQKTNQPPKVKTVVESEGCYSCAHDLLEYDLNQIEAICRCREVLENCFADDEYLCFY